MPKVSVKLQSVEMAQFDPRSTASRIRVTYATNGMTNKFEFPLSLGERNENMSAQVMKEIKKRCAQQETVSDDFLESLHMVDFVNDERVEEMLPAFFQKLYEKGKQLKREKNYTVYMRLLDEIQIQKIVF